jgi:hypothetical protein
VIGHLEPSFDGYHITLAYSMYLVQVLDDTLNVAGYE